MLEAWLKRMKWGLMKVLQRGFLRRHANVTIGAHTYGVPEVLFGVEEGARLTIGRYCCIPQEVATGNEIS